MFKIPAQSFPSVMRVLTQNKNKSRLFSLAVGYVIAHHAPIPSEKQPDPLMFLNGQNQDTKFSFLGALGDLIPTDYDAITAAAAKFWRIRYDIVHAPTVFPITGSNGVYNAFYLGVSLSPEDLGEIKAAGEQFHEYVSMLDAIYDRAKSYRASQSTSEGT